MAHPPPGRHPRHPLRLLITLRPVPCRPNGSAGKAALDGVAQLGRLDIVSANAGIFSFGTLAELPEQTWQDMIDTNLTGVWHAAKAAIPHIKAGGRVGPIDAGQTIK